MELENPSVRESELEQSGFMIVDVKGEVTSLIHPVHTHETKEQYKRFFEALVSKAQSLVDCAGDGVHTLYVRSLSFDDEDSLRKLGITDGPDESFRGDVRWALDEIQYRSRGTLRRLSIAGCGIDDRCFISVAQHMPECQFLTLLCLAGNTITDHGLQIVEQVLGSCRQLETLDLSANQITDKGGQALADKLPMANKLRALDVSYNLLTGTAFSALLQQVKANTALVLQIGPVVKLVAFDGVECFAPAGEGGLMKVDAATLGM